MLRQLARLTAPIAVAGDHACAIAVYADAADRAFAAADLGFEGVACVDDASRAVVLLLDLWQETHDETLLAWARSLLEFLHYMQNADGRFVNFIVDWDGHHNGHGPTSFPGGGFWHARGVRALAKAWVTLNDVRAHDGLVRGLPLIRAARDVPSDVRAIHALMAVELVRAGRMLELRTDVERWCDEIAASHAGDVLHDNPDEREPHLWGHIQEGVLADAGALLGRDDLVAIARRSADAYLAPLVRTRFDLPTVQPYGVASAVHSLSRLAAATRDDVYDDLARDARAWFDGRNTANAPVYDRAAGRVNDGIDDGVVNEHSGAESNIVGAQALIGELVESLPTLRPDVDALLRSADVAARDEPRPLRPLAGARPHRADRLGPAR